MVSGTMKLTRATLFGGSGAIAAQRGDENWGANYVYNHDGLQNDVYLVAEEFKNLSTSGAFATDAEVLAASGAAVINASGGAVNVAVAAITALSGTIYNGSQEIIGGSLNNCYIKNGIAPSTSGDVALGSIAWPFASGFAYAKGEDNVTYKLVVLTGGIISGVVA